MSRKIQAPVPRKGQAPKWPMPREEFGKRFRQSFYDPAFLAEGAALARIEEIAWDGYKEDRKAPITAKAGLLRKRMERSGDSFHFSLPESMNYGRTAT